MPMTPHKLARELKSTRPNGALGSRSTPLAQARPADRLVPAPLGDVVGRREDLRRLLIEQKMIVAEMLTGYVPVEILGFQV